MEIPGDKSSAEKVRALRTAKQNTQSRITIGAGRSLRSQWLPWNFNARRG